jgi:hypothetical protein
MNCMAVHGHRRIGDDKATVLAVFSNRKIMREAFGTQLTKGPRAILGPSWTENKMFRDH